MPTLELGCGPLHKRGDVGIDRLPGPAVDIVHDLNVFPWPLPTATYDQVLCFDVLEHLHQIVAVMEEIHRVGTPDALVLIRVPTGSSQHLYTDPTHIRGFGYRSFDYFVPGRELAARYRYSPATFAIRRIRFHTRPGRWLGALDRLMCAFANAYPQVYEARLAYLYPLDGLHFDLQVLKAAPHRGVAAGPAAG